MSHNFHFNNVYAEANGDSYSIKGLLKKSLAAFSGLKPLYVKYWASSPSINTRDPYPTEDIAFSQTKNKGVAPVIAGEYECSVETPNSYYADKELVPPTIFLQVVSEDSSPVSPVYTVPLCPPNNAPRGIPNYEKLSPYKSQWELMMDQGIME